MAGGGDCGKGAGIAHIIITGVGLIIAIFRVSILMSTQAGEDTTGTVIGTATAGIMNGFRIDDFSRTGRAGIMIAIGKSKKTGASRAINLDRSNRDRN